MIRSIIRDPLFLSKKAEAATKDDLYIATDLKETLAAHRHECVGMAANMIGVNKRIIIILDEDQMIVMFNPEIIKTSKKTYVAEEGCLSHPGSSKETKRYESVKVSYLDENWKKKIKTYTGFTAEIIQHECDHLEGILI
ncbi:peptide deformylase [Intestinibaculum porci]|uniref:Peptide deformylase n=1 Tax=Intestinibaculum porci TaxID=2487118 RepID=A0A3G9J343_9FIRM|nr:peptide deformylase [Intestinibaculum porci]MDD6350431.1 peptide deformylase [Intestinibaculum porci]MDD6421810.1 peptide deformylase [Intestinibaculum porci]BBH25186.1 peptide deformylase [Intestinibaculum porci]